VVDEGFGWHAPSIREPIAFNNRRFTMAPIM
jgi:hypothetical protein